VLPNPEEVPPLAVPPGKLQRRDAHFVLSVFLSYPCFPGENVSQANERDINTGVLFWYFYLQVGSSLLSERIT